MTRASSKIASSNTPSTSRTHPRPDHPVVKEIRRRLGLLKEGSELRGLNTKLGLVVEGGGMGGVVSGGALIAMERVGLTSRSTANRQGRSTRVIFSPARLRLAAGSISKI